MRQYIIAGNWKMNKTVSESVQLGRYQGHEREARYPGHPLEGPGRIHR